ncbi:MAG TPA: hypothetical protein VFE29_08815 [Terriglobia bacterium]|nr:hypothetical protein [Terriglobia bacterium]
MKATLIVLALVGTLLLGNGQMFSFQDDPGEAEARREAARQEAAAEASRLRAMEQKAIAEENARQKFLDASRQQGERNLAAAEERARAAKSQENETKFANLERSAKELMDLSTRAYTQLKSSGAQSVSLTLHADLERMEKLVKEMRKNVK